MKRQMLQIGNGLHLFELIPMHLPWMASHRHWWDGMISDFTLDQIKQMRVQMRDDSRARDHDLLYEIPTVQETADYVQSLVDNVHGNSHNDEYTRQEWLEARNEFTLKQGE
jgi:hypothetical protein